MNVFFYYHGFTDARGSLAGTSRMTWTVANFAKQQFDKVVVAGARVPDSHTCDGIFVERVQESELQRAVCSGFDVVVFASTPVIGRLRKPDGQIWVRSLHCWGFNSVDFGFCLRCDAITAVSKKHEDYLGMLGMPKQNMSVIQNSISEVFYPREEHRDPYSIIYAGAISDNKRIELLLTAYECILKETPTAKLTIVGSSAMTSSCGLYEKTIGDKAAQIGAVMLPAQDQSDLATLYSRHAVVCLPSDVESFGLVLAEAQACGCVAVAHNTGGVSVVVDDSDSGYLYSPNETRALVEAIRKAFSTPDILRPHISAWARKAFDASVTRTDWIRLLKRIGL